MICSSKQKASIKYFPGQSVEEQTAIHSYVRLKVTRGGG